MLESILHQIIIIINMKKEGGSIDAEMVIKSPVQLWTMARTKLLGCMGSW